MEAQTQFKRILPSVLFDVVLPTFDVYSDISLIIVWLIGGHWIYALCMTVPPFLQFLSTIFKWIKLDKDKQWSWIFLLLQFWPQLKAIRVIRLLFKNDSKADEEKKLLHTEIGSTEPFLEAWPTFMLMTIIWIHTLFGLEGGADPANYEAVFGSDDSSNNLTWFFVTYSISAFTTSFGITKLMQVGPCPVLTEEGIFGGLLNRSFIIHFLAVMFSIVTKAIFVGFLLDAAFNGESGSVGMVLTLLLTFTFLPNLILAFISIAKSTGISNNFWGVINRYPALWLLPVATYFVIGPQNVAICDFLCYKKSVNYQHLGISGSLTALNMMITFVLYLPTLLMAYMNLYHADWWIFYACFFPVLVCSWTFTFLSFTCCCCPDGYKKNNHYILVDSDNNRLEIRQCDIEKGDEPLK